jgi:hypothetical protein
MGEIYSQGERHTNILVQTTIAPFLWITHKNNSFAPQGFQTDPNKDIHKMIMGSKCRSTFMP